MPEVSVIVPVYKTEKYLSTCIESILSQTYTDFELVLIDDGSPDNCGSICDTYAELDNRIVVIHKNNGGVSSARNAGIACSNGRYIFFVDSDDYIDADYLSLYMSYGDAPYIAGGYIVHSDDNENGHAYKYTYCKMKIEEFAKNTYEGICKIPTVHVWGVRYLASIIKSNSILFREDVMCSEDNLFNMEYLKFGDILLAVPINGVHYRITGGSAIDKFYTERLSYEKEICYKIQDISRKEADEGFYMVLYIHWITVLEHFYKFYRSSSVAKSKLHEAVTDKYFRQCLRLIMKNGTIDMKIFACCMHLRSFSLYKFVLKVINHITG